MAGTKEIVPVDEVEIQPTDVNPEVLIAKAIEHNLPLDSMERLLAMRRELKTEKAREAYYRDLAAFQDECPTIPKTKEVYNKDKKTLRYKYAPLEVTLKTAGPSLAKHGFSYTFQPSFVEKPPSMLVTCILHHKEGHSESAQFVSPIDEEAYMNIVQKSGSALTYGKRYSFEAVTGLMTGEDDDGQSSGNGKPPVRTSEQVSQDDVRQRTEKELALGNKIRVLLTNHLLTEKERKDEIDWLKERHSEKFLQKAYESLNALINKRSDKQAPGVNGELNDDNLQGTLEDIGVTQNEGNLTEGG